ncbi:MAG: hypothetical protein GXP35_02910 [Actinobacteria bacterium]|nr:hypothetical protein [Actinomycetota bacterium]
MASQLNASSYLDHLQSSGNDLPTLGDTVVLALHPSARPSRPRQLGGPFGAVEIERRGGRVITVSPLGPGPAVVAITVELLAALGVSNIIATGIASVLAAQEIPGDEPSGFVVEAAISNDSVSCRYGDRLHADPELTDLLRHEVGLSTATSYSTSTPFRLDVAAALASGANLIEMEAAAFFSVSNELGLSAGLAVVPSDVTTATSWHPLDPAVVNARVAALAERCRAIAADLR